MDHAESKRFFQVVTEGWMESVDFRNPSRACPGFATRCCGHGRFQPVNVARHTRM
jgi:hypothetical protein